MVSERVGGAGSCAAWRCGVDTTDPPRGAVLAEVEERSTVISNELLFVELEWAAMSDEAVAAIIDDPALGFCRHHLRSVRRSRPHLLSEPEERILADKSVTGRGAWSR